MIRGVSLNIDNTSEDGEALFGKRSAVQYDSGPPDRGQRDAVKSTALTTNYPFEFSWLSYVGGWDTGDMCLTYPRPAHIFSYNWAIGGTKYVFGNLAAGASRTVKFAYRAF